MNINQIIKNGAILKLREPMRLDWNRELGVVRGPLPRWALKQNLSGMAKKLGAGYRPI